MKRKTIALISVLLVLSLGIMGCDSSNNESEPIEEVGEVADKVELEEVDDIGENEAEVEEEEVEEIETDRLQGLKDDFKDEGFEIGENETIAFAMLEANSGMKFTLDGELIEIYEYDLKNLTEEAERTVEQAENGSVDMSGFNIPVIYNNGLMLVRHDEHSQKEAIVDIFNSY